MLSVRWRKAQIRNVLGNWREINNRGRCLTEYLEFEGKKQLWKVFDRVCVNRGLLRWYTLAWGSLALIITSWWTKNCYFLPIFSYFQEFSLCAFGDVFHIFATLRVLFLYVDLLSNSLPLSSLVLTIVQMHMSGGVGLGEQCQQQRLGR